MSRFVNFTQKMSSFKFNVQYFYFSLIVNLYLFLEVYKNNSTAVGVGSVQSETIILLT